MELPKAYEPQNYEDKIYEKWEKSGLFNPDVCVEKGFIKKNANYFSIVLPPPNRTGTLHMGHAAMLAIEDIMVRYHRMKGERTWWIPGTDHAAIATQTKVEKILKEKKGQTRHDLGREKFLEEVKKFAEESHGTIVRQTKKMGSSLDWDSEAYTLDEVRSRAVRLVFKKMYDDGLIYRGNRIVNWCPRCHSTLADDEVEYKTQKAKLYTFKYDKDFPIRIATTRPETKLGDTAVAVNPKDKRYKKFIGKIFKANFCGRELNIKIISDESVDMNYGTGALGVTPAHSQIDFAMAEKNGLEVKKIIDEDGKMVNAGEFSGLDVIAAREKVVEKLEAAGLLEKVEEVEQNISLCYRCEAVVEPLTSLQWFIKVNSKFKIQNSKLKGIKSGQEVTLKQLMKHVVETDQIKIIPERFEKIYFHWIDNLRDWCVSRQIWFGHRIPVWQKGEEIYVGAEKPKGEGWIQDSDTLDTWFSSGLWTFTTMLEKENFEQHKTLEDWIKNSPKIKEYHPTSVLETGYDILFFWVARMILMTTYVMGEIPFKEVYLHGLIRDEKGQKMSKSLGNVIDPLDMIKKYGADATRLSLVIGTGPGNDMKLSEEKVAGFRNFTNKLWNISRYILMPVDGRKKNVILIPSSRGEESNLETLLPLSGIRMTKLTLADKWILSRFNKLKEEYTKDLENYNFSQAGEKLRDFTWNEFADWYVEISKIEKGKDDVLVSILIDLLKMWHPFMAFVTEQIWQEMGMKEMLLVEKWPEQDKELIDEKAEKDFDLISNIIISVRNARAEFKIIPAEKLKIVFKKENKLIKENEEIIKGLARLEAIEFGAKPEKAIALVVGEMEFYLELGDAVDFRKEGERIKDELGNLEKYVKGLNAKLSNKEFVKKAPEQIVNQEKEKLEEAEGKLEKLNKQLESLK
ncbi:MAG: valine--tRNA ligase [Patescibacteria group bacterium]|nr:valine--tRNA ligase [Patescibacteria group bacterium]MDD5490798.1 valine--tRNA ligase [Patescibacteria group bacterium]